MKKITFLLLGLLLTLPAAAQMQKGYVKTRGRLAENGAVIPGKRLAGAFVKVRGRQGVRSNAKGDFAIPVDRNFYVERAELAGYTVADRDLLSRRYDYSAGNPLIVVLEKPDTQLQDKLAAERKIRRTLRRQLDRREAELDRLREAQRITQARHDSLLQALYEDQSKSEKLIADMAERYASIDFDQESDLNRRISACILNGELMRADSLLRTKGDIHERAAALQRHRDLNDAEAEELARRQENLDQSRRLVTHDLEELAADCYRRYELCLVEHRNDSAAHYLEFRAALDTTNVDWALDAGNFLYSFLSHYDDAMFYYERALRNAQKQYGLESTVVAVMYNNMGNVHNSKGNYSIALSYYTNALEIYNSTTSDCSLDKANCLSNIGLIYEMQDLYSEALSYYTNALEEYKAAKADSSSCIANCYDNMGVVYSKQGDYAKAIECYYSALDIYKSIGGGDWSGMANCYSHIGSEFLDYEVYSEALSMCSAALDIYTTFYGETHPDVATCRYNIGRIHEAQGDYEEALSNYNKSLEIYRSIYGKSHLMVAESYFKIGSVYTSQGLNAEALKNYLAALDIYYGIKDVDPGTVAFCCYAIGCEYGKLGDNETALRSYSAALQIYKLAGDEMNPNMMKCYCNIGSIYVANELYDEAMEKFSLATEIAEQVYGKEQIQTAICYNNMAYVYGAKGNYPESLKYAELALSIFKENSPEDHYMIDQIEGIINAAKSAIAGDR